MLRVVFTFLLLLPLSLTSSSSSSTEEDSKRRRRSSSCSSEVWGFYDLLQANGLPIGVVPKDIEAFEVDGEGRFELRLEAPCNARRFENEVHYDAHVSGSISYGQIGDLTGVSAQELFLWLPVKGIRVDVPSSGVIYFDVGDVRKQFQLSLFDTPPVCQADDFMLQDANMELRHCASNDVTERAVM